MERLVCARDSKTDSSSFYPFPSFSFYPLSQTIHTWNFDSSPNVPLGPPSLMMAFTADGQVDPTLISTRDEIEQRSTEHKRELRAGYLDLSYEPLEGCDQAMKTGKGLRLEAKEVEVARPTKDSPAKWEGKASFASVLRGERKKD
jgi:hypothetical protein